MQRRSFLLQSAALATGMASASSVRAATHGADIGLGYPVAANFGYPGANSIVVAWNRALTSAIAATQTPATIAARACSMVHEAIYNAWAAYDSTAAFTLSSMRKVTSKPTVSTFPGQVTASSYWVPIAASYAAYTVLADLFPSQLQTFVSLLAFVNANPFNGVRTLITAQQVGTLAGNSLLQARHPDGSNQLGDMAPGAYADYTGYVPVNTPDKIFDITRWQPLRLVNAAGITVVQQYLTPQWGLVRPFALSSGSVFRPVMAHRAPTSAEMDQLIYYNLALDDTSKSQVDLWAGNPGTVSPPGEWMQIAEQVSANDANSLDQDVKLFFATAQAVLDASIAAWDTKRYYDSVRPITAIPYYYAGLFMFGWGGPDRGRQFVLSENWRPYQRSTNPTPPFPEYVSGHSTFSASAAAVIAGVRGSDTITITGSVAPGGITFETNMPSQIVTFTFSSLSAAAAAAGLSRRIGGIHFQQGDLDGRALGQRVGSTVLARCQALFAGRSG